MLVPVAILRLAEGCARLFTWAPRHLQAHLKFILNANIRGTYNIQGGAQKHGVKRVLFVRSNPATGFHRRETWLDAKSEIRPDSIYGVSKGFGEFLVRYWYDPFGIETAAFGLATVLKNR
ncbi:MAG: hypothetical protein COB16_09170 [Rhodobacteraceae bacterium]|nr:MAG: hypothetical protein COB16_09170 [Paracoccaceae bacterium]